MTTMQFLTALGIGIVTGWITYCLEMTRHEQNHIEKRFRDLTKGLKHLYKEDLNFSENKGKKFQPKRPESYEVNLKKFMVMTFGWLIFGGMAAQFLPPYLGFLILALCVTFCSYRAIQLAMRIKRNNEIRRELPGILDLMIICLGAGLGINAAFERIAKELEESPLGMELHQMVNETNAGLPLDESLKSFAVRNPISEIQIVSAHLIQAYRSGAQLMETFKVLSESVREKIRMSTKEKMMRIPVLVLLPMVLCILPVILIMVIGPGLISFTKNF